MCIRKALLLCPSLTPDVKVAELNDACEALTLDKEQLALEKEDLQVGLRPALEAFVVARALHLFWYSLGCNVVAPRNAIRELGAVSWSWQGG